MSTPGPENDTAFKASQWLMNVNEKVFGPFSGERMLSFAQEGRLAAHSLVKPLNGERWTVAAQTPEFKTTFAPKAATRPAPRTFGQARTDDTTECANFLIVLELHSGTGGDAAKVIETLGQTYRVSTNVWMLSAHSTTAAIRNAILPYLSFNDTLMVIDASRNRATWHNYGPERDVQMRAVWSNGSAQKTA